MVHSNDLILTLQVIDILHRHELHHWWVFLQWKTSNQTRLLTVFSRITCTSYNKAQKRPRSSIGPYDTVGGLLCTLYFSRHYYIWYLHWHAAYFYQRKIKCFWSAAMCYPWMNGSQGLIQSYCAQLLHCLCVSITWLFECIRLHKTFTFLLWEHFN